MNTPLIPSTGDYVYMGGELYYVIQGGFYFECSKVSGDYWRSIASCYHVDKIIPKKKADTLLWKTLNLKS